MKLTSFIKNKEKIKNYQKQIFTIGAFDGCHLGHMRLLDGSDFAITFTPTPKYFFNKNNKLLTLDYEKQNLYPNFIFVEFNKKIANLSANEFFSSIINTFNPIGINLGWDFKFGHKLQGNFELIKQISKEKNIQVHIQNPITCAGTTVKSTTIKELLISGQVKKANLILGYEYFYMTSVILGHGIGKKLGFPTLNFKINPIKLLPHNGVYAGYVSQNNTWVKAAISLGFNPTIPDHTELSLEAHLLDFDKYSQENFLKNPDKKIVFTKFIRNQKKFSSQKELAKQIDKDVNLIKKLLF